MSRNEWEAGSIQIPTRAWAPLKKALREAHNDNRDQVLARAERVQQALQAAFKGKRNVQRVDVVREIERAMRGCPGECFEAVDSLVNASLKDDGGWRTSKITQAQLDQHVAPKATNKALSYEGDGWVIRLDDAARKVHWRVDENNHAVEGARASHMGQALFRLLRKIDYGNRQTMGGVLVGNDEHNRDDNLADGGANYVTARFGKAGDAE